MLLDKKLLHLRGNGRLISMSVCYAAYQVLEIYMDFIDSGFRSRRNVEATR